MTNAVHEYLGSPINLIWNSYTQLTSTEANIALLFKSYRRKKTGSYYNKNSKTFMTTLRKNSRMPDLLGVIESYKGDEELAFLGFRKILSNTDLFSYKPTNDILRCDMKFDASNLYSTSVKNVLTEIKAYVNLAPVYLYKTTNSFHLYAGKMEDYDGIVKWNRFLKKLDAKYPGVIDRDWVLMNPDSQPIRITSTPERGVPVLVSEI